MSAGRLREAFATVSSTPWRRAPLLLVRRTGLLVATAGASAVVAASLASVPLFTSSVGSASVDLQVDERCPRDTGFSRTFTAAAASLRTPSPDPFAGIADQVGPSNWWAHVEDVPLDGGDRDSPLTVTLLVRGGALDHVDVVEQVDGPGIWLSTRAQEQTSLGAGDVATLGSVRVGVAGVYGDESGPVVDDFWCSNGYLLQPRGEELVPPPPVVLVDRSTLAAVMQDLEIPIAEGAWEAPLLPGRSLTQVDDLLDTVACRGDDDAVRWCASGSQPRLPDTSGRFRDQPIRARDDADFVTRFLSSSLPFVSERTRAIQTSVGSGVWAISALATLAGLGLVSAAASLWSDRRRREVALLAVRGVSRAGIGVKAVLELAPALVIGAAAGTAIAYAAVAGIGPSSDIEADAVVRAVFAGAAAVVVGATVTGTVGAVRAAPPGARRTIRRGWLAWVPWEAALVGATLVSYDRLGEWGVPTGRGAEVSRVDLWGLLFPVLFLVTAVAILARLLVLLVRPLRAASRGWPFALYLGVRRVARYRVAAIGMVAGAALAAGVLGYSGTMDRSLDTTLRAKGQLFVGSDVAVQIAPEVEIPPALRGRATEVRFFRRAWLQRDQREGVTVLAIDPDTFAQGVFWDGSFASKDLDRILERLRDPGDGVVPAVVVGTTTGERTELGVAGSNTTTLDIAPIDGVEAFPGMKPQEATVYVDHEALERLGARGGTREAWVRGDHDEVLADMAAAGAGHLELRTLTGIADQAAFRTVGWTFGFLQTIGVAAGLLVLGGLAVYLDARRRDRVLGYAFMRRMGLSRRAHRRALAVELAASVLAGAVVGLAMAIATASLAYSRIDPVPRYAPDPLLRYATGTIGGLLAVTVGLTVVAAIAGQRQVDRDDPVEVIRGGT